MAHKEHIIRVDGRIISYAPETGGEFRLQSPLVVLLHSGLPLDKLHLLEDFVDGLVLVEPDEKEREELRKAGFTAVSGNHLSLSSLMDRRRNDVPHNIAICYDPNDDLKKQLIEDTSSYLDTIRKSYPRHHHDTLPYAEISVHPIDNLPRLLLFLASQLAEQGTNDPEEREAMTEAIAIEMYYQMCQKHLSRSRILVFAQDAAQQTSIRNALHAISAEPETLNIRYCRDFEDLDLCAAVDTKPTFVIADNPVSLVHTLATLEVEAHPRNTLVIDKNETDPVRLEESIWAGIMNNLLEGSFV